ncbi:hypothetical protein PAXRUDRAFT_588231 [Paxillus rubicundulus Ve08.2h10]|uniref:Uncharacterized protein n=1 Tax=Paxillus rubicundulus Ve08.2h10 TaxID=930991 RepID=A0A0D0E456_9AGAM|nr:hypothetical protein PAXRUDRAFT_588231 [Paxillus rubicundulus Ve08.2h10]
MISTKIQAFELPEVSVATSTALSPFSMIIRLSDMSELCVKSACESCQVNDFLVAHAHSQLLFIGHCLEKLPIQKYRTTTHIESCPMHHLRLHPPPSLPALANIIHQTRHFLVGASKTRHTLRMMVGGMMQWLISS